MARGQQKVVVPKEDLPAVSRLSDGNYGYIIRYRIVSEDQNRFSHWSPIRELPLPSLQPVTGDLSIIGGTAIAVWGDEESRPNYDIFVSFNGDPYLYHGTAPTHTYTFILEDNPTTVQVSIQIESIDKQIAPELQIFESNVINLI